MSIILSLPYWESDITITNISQSLPYAMVGKTASIDTVWRNCITVTLCILLLIVFQYVYNRTFLELTPTEASLWIWIFARKWSRFLQDKHSNQPCHNDVWYRLLLSLLYFLFITWHTACQRWSTDNYIFTMSWQPACIKWYISNSLMTVLLLNKYYNAEKKPCMHNHYT